MRDFLQHDIMDCAPTCIKIIAAHYGKNLSLQDLRELCYLNREGVSLLNLTKACQEIGFNTHTAQLTVDELQTCPLPAILHWNQNHYVVLRKITYERKHLKDKHLKFILSDPAHGSVKVDGETFEKCWIGENGKGTALILQPDTEFLANQVARQDEVHPKKFLLKYLFPHWKYIIQLIIGMICLSVFSMTVPFLMQLLIDSGVRESNMNVIYLVVLSQLILFVGATVTDIIQSWLLLHVNIRINLNIISDFLKKLLRLPITYFDSKGVGDISQRINDHRRIELFLTSTTLATLFSMVSICIYSIVLAIYSWKIFTVFAGVSFLAVMYILLFQRKRKELDYKRFARNKENQDKLYEMIIGMRDIKLYGSEDAKREEWESIQVKLFQLNIAGLSLEQYQKTGYIFLSQLKNIFISFLAATAVVQGNFTLGVLLSISYIIGQTNGPLEQLVGFIKTAQDARLSIDRMSEIHNKKDEEPLSIPIDDLKKFKAFQGSLELDNVSFQYEGPTSPFVLENINLHIPYGKTTAIVGASGSGKTTLMKLLLNFYSPTSGLITMNGIPIQDISPKLWRSRWGTVMQDGYIFSDSIERNIVLSGEDINQAALLKAVEIANIKEFIEALPLTYATKIGNEGIGLSGGQKQRLLIARAIYNNPEFLFFDEATSSLDADNEIVIMQNLDRFLTGRTAIIIAHRLSTVKNADQIIVLKQGRIVETGSHFELTQRKGYYFNLIKNQLELA